MPHLQFEVSEPLDSAEIDAFADWVTARYAEHMDTGTGHVGVTVRAAATLALGRADRGAPVAFLNADIRAGRSAAQRRDFAVAVMDELHARFGVPTEHCYVVYTEHPGEDFHLREGALASWDTAEGDDADPLDG